MLIPQLENKILLKLSIIIFQCVTNISQKTEPKAIDPDGRLDKCKLNTSLNINYITTIANPSAPSQQLHILPTTFECVQPNNICDETLNAKEDIDSLNHISEINAAVRSLKTNLFLSSAFVLIFVSLAVLSDTVSVVLVTTIRGFVPIVTTLVNFAKVYNVFCIYYAIFMDNFCVLVKFVMCKRVPAT